MYRKYWEAGYSVIPVKGKRPFINDWSRFCVKAATEEEIDAWEEKYKLPEYGVGLCCGPASNIDALDWDTESPDLKMLIPISPIIRYGSKGGMSLFRHNPTMKSAKKDRNNLGPNKDKAKEGVEFLSTGRMFVLPPSIHPDTLKPYIWRTLDTLDNYASNDLPMLKQDDVDEILGYIQEFNNTTTLRTSPGGRNNRLTQIACAIICSNSWKTNEEIAQEIYDLDQKEHARPYFSDKEEMYYQRSGGNASLAALLFVKGNRKRLIDKGLATISIPIIVRGEKTKPVVIPDFPSSSGLIDTIKKSIMRVSRSSGQDELATGAALAICSTLASNRFHISGVPAITHQYIMCVARTGKGKGAALKIADKLFGSHQLKKYNLGGLSNYSSNAAFVEHLKEQRSRLDILDEFGSTLKGMAGGSDLKKEMESLFCSIYSNAGDYFKGHNTKGQNGQGACYSPAVTIFANIQENILVENATRGLIESGFLPRFMYFSANEDTDRNPHYLTSFDVEPIAKECERIFPWYKYESVLPDGQIVTDLGEIEPRRKPLIIGPDVLKYRDNIDNDFYEKDRESIKRGDVLGAAFLTRQFENLNKIAIVNAICSDRNEILKDDYDYAFNVTFACLTRATGYLKVMGSSSILEKNMNKILNVLDKKGALSKKDMSRFSNLYGNDFKQAFSALNDQGLVGNADGAPNKYAKVEH